MSSSKRLIEADAADTTEKKQRPAVFAPKFFRDNKIDTATVQVGSQYKANDNKTRFQPPVVLGAANFEFMECMDRWGPDLLVLIHPSPGASAKHRLTLHVHRKTDEAREYRVTHQEIEMKATETDDSFTVVGPDFKLELKGEERKRPGQTICQKAEEVSKRMTAISDAARAKIESEISSLGFPLERIAFLCDGRWRMQFDNGPRSIQVDALSFPVAVIRENSTEPMGDRELQILIHYNSDPSFMADGSVDKVLAEFKAFLKH